MSDPTDTPNPCLGSEARRILGAPDPRDKAIISHRAARAWFSGRLRAPSATAPPPPDRPARPDRPVLVRPRDVPRRNRNRPTTLLHAVAHIELNAIDLAWDLIARFAGPATPREFLDDWVRVADDEARHFEMLNQRLHELGSFYGEFPAHDGLWEAALETRHDLLGRLAVVPMVLEARGLDVTPVMIERFRRQDDAATVRILETILRDEITHVAAGTHWFSYYCTRQALDPRTAFSAAVRRYYKGRLKAPFNDLARREAGMPRDYYDPSTAPYLVAVQSPNTIY